VTVEHRDITAALEALACYEDRTAVVHKYDPNFDPARGDKFSVEFEPALGEGARMQSFSLNVVRDGESVRHRIGGHDFLTIMAATNLKQRIRMLCTYRIADEQNLLVIGTSNRPELSQGFFVKHGDGCGEAFPLRHLLKTQVYEVAEHIGVPNAVMMRPPTTDTFSADQSQEAYFYGTSVTLGDELWLAWSKGEDPVQTGARVGMAGTDVEKFFGLYSRRAAYGDYLRETL
jgi:NAD+ synthase